MDVACIFQSIQYCTNPLSALFQVQALGGPAGFADGANAVLSPLAGAEFTLRVLGTYLRAGDRYRIVRPAPRSPPRQRASDGYCCRRGSSLI